MVKDKGVKRVCAGKAPSKQTQSKSINDKEKVKLRQIKLTDILSSLKQNSKTDNSKESIRSNDRPVLSDQTLHSNKESGELD